MDWKGLRAIGINVLERIVVCVRIPVMAVDIPLIEPLRIRRDEPPDRRVVVARSHRGETRRVDGLVEESVLVAGREEPERTDSSFVGMTKGARAGMTGGGCPLGGVRGG